MEIGIYANTHGNSYRDDANMLLAHTPVQEMQPVRVAKAAEAAGFHSIWYPDHVSMPIGSESFHTANQSGQRAYRPWHNMLDAAVVMGAVATSTSRIKLGTSVLISPYRHPLSDARQFMTVDQLSDGRLMLGVGAGWMKEEFESVGIDHAERNERMVECIEIYKRCWEDERVNFDGEFYSFENLSMDPKPLQGQRPPILLGANTPAGARRAAKHCDGIYSLFLDTHIEFDRFDQIQDILRAEREKTKRDTKNFLMIGATSGRVSDPGSDEITAVPRCNCTGTPEQVLGDLERYAKAGYSLIIVMFDCPSGTLAEHEEQITKFGEQIIPTAKTFKPAGEWLPVS